MDQIKITERDVLYCPVLGCVWTYEAPHPALRGEWPSIQAAVSGSMKAHVEGVESAIVRHLNDHDLKDFVESISDLRAEVEIQRNRAHLAEAKLGTPKAVDPAMPPRADVLQDGACFRVTFMGRLYGKEWLTRQGAEISAKDLEREWHQRHPVLRRCGHPVTEHVMCRVCGSQDSDFNGHADGYPE